MEERGRTAHARVGTVSTKEARPLQCGGHGTTPPSRDGMSSDVSYPKPCSLRSGDGPTDVSITVLNRPALAVLADANVRSGPRPPDTLSQVAKINAHGVERSGSLRAVELRQSGRGGPSPLNDRLSTACYRHIHPRHVTAVMDPCNNRSPFTGVVMEV